MAEKLTLNHQANSALEIFELNEITAQDMVTDILQRYNILHEALDHVWNKSELVLKEQVFVTLMLGVRMG